MLDVRAGPPLYEAVKSGDKKTALSLLNKGASPVIAVYGKSFDITEFNLGRLLIEEMKGKKTSQSIRQ